MSAIRDNLLAALREAVGKPCPTNDALGLVFACNATSISDGIVALERQGKISIERAGRSSRRIIFPDGTSTDWTRIKGQPDASTLRKCLCCDRQIFSTGPGHRMCDACKRDA